MKKQQRKRCFWQVGVISLLVVPFLLWLQGSNLGAESTETDVDASGLQQSVELKREQEVLAKMNEAVGDEISISPETARRLAVQAACDLPQEALFAQFPQDEQGEWLYPDDFAGVYQGEGKLVVCLTSMNRAEWYMDVMNHDPHVELQLREHSYADLEAAARAIAEDYEVESSGVSAEHNAVRIYTDQVRQMSLMDEEKGLYMYKSRLGSVPVIVEHQPSASEERELWGGDPLSRSAHKWIAPPCNLKTRG